LDELSLTLVTDRTLTRGRELTAAVAGCLAAGLPAVQAREKDLGAGELAVLCRRLRELTRDHGARLIVNDRVDVALAVEADAVQRTHASLPVDDIRRVAGGRLAIGASVHSLEDAIDAERRGADWLVFGPVYDTPSKRRWGPPQGLERLRTVARGVRVPVVAIGGITPENCAPLVSAGADFLAVIAAVWSHPEGPAAAVRAFHRAIDAALAED
jgi:thiamine-phosphate pyrophosphorylase